MKCSECKNCEFSPDKGGVNRYYCTDKRAAAAVNAGARLICKTERHKTEMTIKTAPHWCPRKYEN